MASVPVHVLTMQKVVYGQGLHTPIDDAWSSCHIRFIKLAQVATGKFVTLIVRDKGKYDFSGVEGSRL